MITGRGHFSWRSGFALLEVTFLSQDLVNRWESAMRGSGEEHSRRRKWGRKGPEVGVCLVYLRIKKPSMAAAQRTRGRGKAMRWERWAGPRSGRAGLVCCSRTLNVILSVIGGSEGQSWNRSRM